MKVAVIGTGFGERIAAPVWRQVGCEVTAVLSPRDREGIERACAGEVDLISIHSPPFLHHKHVMLALDHGRNVLCDKPFGRNPTEARAMRDRAEAVGVLHFLNFEFRLMPARVKAKALIDAGAIGALQHVSWTFIGSGLRPQAFRWLFDRSQAGGWIGAFGSHVIDSLRFFYGREVVSCGGVMRTEVRERLDRAGQPHRADAEDAFSAWFVFEGGGTANLDTAFASTVPLPHRVYLLGSEGTIEIVDDVDVIFHCPGREADSYIGERHVGDLHEPGLVPWFTTVHDAVCEGRLITPNFADGLAVAQAMDRLRANSIEATPPGSPVESEV